MIFSSLTYVVFFTIVATLLAATNAPIFCRSKRRPQIASVLRHSILLIASYVFCGWFDPRFALIVLATTVVSYFCAINIEKKDAWAKTNLRIAIVLPLATLGVFKYYNFFLSSFAAVFATNVDSLGALKLILPLGISFYVFQVVGYAVDVWRGKLSAERNFLRFALYVAFFPRFIAGPIVKGGDFLPQLHENRNVGLKNLEIGIQIFLFGLFKKIVVADRLAVFVDQVYATPQAFHGFTVLMAVIAYSLQIYFDFAGYTDMAIGSAKILGYDLPKNFNLPYLSRNPTEFWKRWHISLSSWLMDYLYIPLGGNRKGKLRSYANLLTTMLIGGLWHGASWTFVAWGGLHGLALCVHKFVRGDKKKREATLTKRGVLRSVKTLASILGTFAFVSFCWILFRAENFQLAATIIGRLFVWGEGEGVVFVSSWFVLYVALTLVLSGIAYCVYRRRLEQSLRSNDAEKQQEVLHMTKRGVDGFYPIMDLTKLSSLTLLAALFYFILCFAYIDSNPFIYLQF